MDICWIIKAIHHRDLLRNLVHCKKSIKRVQRGRYIRNLLQPLTKQVTIKYYKYQLSGARDDYRYFWLILNEIAGRPTKGPPFPFEVWCGTGASASASGLREIANSFSWYLGSVGTYFLEANEPVDSTELDCSSWLFSLQELFRAVTRILKDDLLTLYHLSLHIVHLSIRFEEFPDVSKINNVVPIYKSSSNAFKKAIIYQYCCWIKWSLSLIGFLKVSLVNIFI